MENVADIYELSPTQEGMLFHTLLEPDSRSYLQSVRFKLCGELNPALFQQAWQWVIDRHPSLRAGFFTEDMEKPLQVIFDKTPLPWYYEDLSAIPSEAGLNQRLQHLIAQENRTPFTLSQAPLMRFCLLKLTDADYQFIWTHHHILLDGWCLPIIFKDVFTCYADFAAGKTAQLPETRPETGQGSYRDFIRWQQARDWQADRAYWRQQLDGITAPTQLLIDQGRRQTAPQPASESSVFEKVSTRLTPRASQALAEFARRCQVPLSVVLQTAWGLLLHHYSRSDDVVFGLTVAGRPPQLAGVESIVGLFINTLPVRIHFAVQDSLQHCFQQVFEQQAARQAHQYLPLADIQSQTAVPSGTPLFDTLLVIENYPIDIHFNQAIAGVRATDFVFEEKTNYPLTAVVAPGEATLISFSYDPKRFNRQDMSGLLQQFEALLQAMQNNIEQPAVRAPLHEPALQALPEAVSLTVNSIPQWFKRQAQATPDNIALSFAHGGSRETLSYAELDAASERLAAALLAQGVPHQSHIGLCLQRSPKVVVSILGIFKAGCVYVPIDPANPSERRQFIAEDAQLAAIITDSEGGAEGEAAAAFQHLCPVYSYESLYESLLAEASTGVALPDLKPNEAAYIIYTSGSTGQPKGVKVSHYNVLRLMAATESLYDFNAKDVWTLFHSYAFDFSVWEIWGALFYGGRLVVAPAEVTKSSQDTYRLLQQEQVTVFNQTPSAFYGLLEYCDAQGLQSLPLALRYVIFGGEALQPARLKTWFNRFQPVQQPVLVNMYGITETTVHVTAKIITETECENAATGKASPIGKPIADLGCYVVNSHGDIAAPGAPGELYIGGAGVTMGYHNRPELTAQRFIESSDIVPGSDSQQFSNSQQPARLYRSGDLVRQLADGELVYLGRIDSQIKLRGYRIELDEIAAVIRSHESVSDVAVTVMKGHQGNDQSADTLVAYIVYKAGYYNDGDSAQQLKQFLRQRLPEYMIPAFFIALSSMPLTTNGKLDYRALPKVEQTAIREQGAARVAPQNELQQCIATIWQAVLGWDQTRPLSVQDNFFDVGGNSLLVVRVHSRLESALQRSLPMVALFTYPTIEQLAGFLAGDGEHNLLHQRQAAGAERGAARQQRTQARGERRSLRQGRRQQGMNC